MIDITPEFLVALLLAGLATWRLALLLVEDEISRPLREAVWKRKPPSTMIGYAFTCVKCTSMWFAVPLAASCILEPTICILICLPLALSAVAIILDRKSSTA